MLTQLTGNSLTTQDTPAQACTYSSTMSIWQVVPHLFANMQMYRLDAQSEACYKKVVSIDKGASTEAKGLR